MGGFDLYARGDYWDAHEAWEDDWRAARHGSPERARLAGLIQLCAAAIQAQRGRWRGVATLTCRARANLDAAGERALADEVTAWGQRVVDAHAWSPPPALASGVSLRADVAELDRGETVRFGAAEIKAEGRRARGKLPPR